jgi:hypothetical protein
MSPQSSCFTGFGIECTQSRPTRRLLPACTSSPERHRLCSAIQRRGKRLSALIARTTVGIAQRAAGRNNARTRQDLLRIDEQLNDMLAFTGRPE